MTLMEQDLQMVFLEESFFFQNLQKQFLKECRDEISGIPGSPEKVSEEDLRWGVWNFFGMSRAYAYHAENL